MSDAVTARLEAVAARLERVAARLGGGGGGDDDEVPLWVADYEAICNKEVKELAAAIDKIELKGASEPLLQAYACSLSFIKRVPKSKKATVPEMDAVLADAKAAYDALQKKAEPRGKAARKSDRDLEMLYTAVREAANAVFWVKYEAPGMTPKQYVEGNCAATAQTKVTQLILKCKDDAKKQKAKDLSPALKALFEKLTDFIKTNFKTGLSWNPKGASIADVSGGASSAAAPAAATGGDDEKKEAAAPKKSGGGGGAKKKAAGGGMNAVFGQLNKGLDVTKGMKKVTKDMKTKNRKDRSGKVVSKGPKKKEYKYAGQGSTKYAAGRWIIEKWDPETAAKDARYAPAQGLITPLDAAQKYKLALKDNVFISNCEDVTINIPEKCKAVTINDCKKVRVFVKEIISSVEIVKGSSVKVIVVDGGKVPAYTVDKTESASIILSRTAFEANPDIYSSGVTAMNVEYPGKTENDDNRECPIPEQFLTKIDPKTGKVTTTATEH